MLIYARIILAVLILSAVLSGLGAFFGILFGNSASVVALLIAGVFFWLAYSNFNDATECANKLSQ